ncbi:AraC family transcriptional regulator [Chryseobacterium arthrosphaerae]|uniref:AraC family transcriptional regulator n=1 Tax=Chryseobacterium arthrosphaerae TaxID=651561 RepID=A0A432DSX2_9FLAO|nr:AraC family transcriptional regulator [Chryseobacterium arthrosphaerae]
MLEKVQGKDSGKISKEKEEEILRKLEEFEQSDRYLNKSMSLSALSSQMEINTKYLSEVINTSKGKNFNGYINELRINHIAHLLRTEPSFLNYKVSYLAEYSGFSSHSAFTTVFKSVTGMSPNAYIQESAKQNIMKYIFTIIACLCFCIFMKAQPGGNNAVIKKARLEIYDNLTTPSGSEKIY